MKKGTKMSRTVGTLEGLYNHLNEDFFKGELPIPIITVQSSPRSYGHCTVRKVWKREEEDYTYELIISWSMVSSISSTSLFVYSAEMLSS